MTSSAADPYLANMADSTSLDPDCVGQRYWYVFLISSLFTFFGGLIVIYLWRFFTFVVFTYFGNKFKTRVRAKNS